MTTGQLIRKNLGLEKIPNARINRALGSAVKILFVWYDSYRRNMPVTTFRLRKYPLTATMFVGTELARGKRHAIFSPPVDLDTYNGNLRGAMVIPVNLAGDRFMKKDQFSKKFESEEVKEPQLLFQFNQSLMEFVTAYDLKDKGNISDFTTTWRKDRSRVMGQESATAKLIDCFIDEAGKSVTFGFLTESTELGGKNPNPNINSNYKFYTGDKGELDPDNFNIKANRSKTYEMQIKILEFFDWLDVFEGESIKEKEMKEILEVSNVQIFSTSPSFHWQGMNYNLSQLDASIYPTDIDNPVWGPRHGDKSGYFLDKHLSGLLRQVSFWLNPMASMLSKKLKDRGLI